MHLIYTMNIPIVSSIDWNILEEREQEKLY